LRPQRTHTSFFHWISTLLTALGRRTPTRLVMMMMMMMVLEGGACRERLLVMMVAVM
jgi:hypothetical protein